jgi:hypothetical protein
MIPRTGTVRHNPLDLSRVEINCSEASVRWLGHKKPVRAHQREPLRRHHCRRKHGGRSHVTLVFANVVPGKDTSSGLAGEIYAGGGNRPHLISWWLVDQGRASRKESLPNTEFPETAVCSLRLFHGCGFGRLRHQYRPCRADKSQRVNQADDREARNQVDLRHSTHQVRLNDL